MPYYNRTWFRDYNPYAAKAQARKRASFDAVTEGDRLALVRAGHVARWESNKIQGYLVLDDGTSEVWTHTQAAVVLGA